MISASGSHSWKVAVDRALGCSYGALEGSNQEEESADLVPTQSTVPVERIVVRNSEREGMVLQPIGSMDPAIWSNLPFHLLETVLAWLPISSLLKLRCVCKRFNNILYSASLRDVCRHRSHREAAWYLFRGEGRECAAFNPEADSWCKLPLGFLPSSKGRVVATAGGLLCVRQGDKMTVCNPLSKAWLELPPIKNSWKFPIVGKSSCVPNFSHFTQSVCFASNGNNMMHSVVL